MSNLAIHMLDPVAQNLHRLMSSRKISEAELSRQTHIPQPTIHKILTGKTSDPRASTLRALADYFQISIDELIAGVVIKRQTAFIHSIPVISWAESVNAQEKISTLTPSNWDKWVTTEPLSDTCFAVLSKPCMAIRFPVGTALVIDPSLKPEDGDIVLVHYSNTPEATLRQIAIDGPSTLLSNLYGNTTTYEMTPDVTIKGVLIRSIFSFHE